MRVLIAEDFAPFRQWLYSSLRNRPGFSLIREVADGLEAVQEAAVLQPDLVLLDIRLPSLNGLDAARQIRKLSPKSKLLFVSQESSADVVQEALRIGASGYILKANAVIRCRHSLRIFNSQLSQRPGQPLLSANLRRAFSRSLSASNGRLNVVGHHLLSALSIVH
jgi:DNA-binding NarL/FixJ family response regulator